MGTVLGNLPAEYVLQHIHVPLYRVQSDLGNRDSLGTKDKNRLASVVRWLNYLHLPVFQGRFVYITDNLGVKFFYQ